MFRERLHRDVVVVNDADAAGLAEARYGAAKGRNGLVVMTTLGTGIGTALVYDGVLVPNSELGHLEIDGKDAETQAANSARERKDLSLVGVGRAAHPLLPHPGEADLPRPVRRRRRGQQARRQVPPAAGDRHPDRARDTAQHRRHRGRRSPGGRGRAHAAVTPRRAGQPGPCESQPPLTPGRPSAAPPPPGSGRRARRAPPAPPARRCAATGRAPGRWRRPSPPRPPAGPPRADAATAAARRPAAGSGVDSASVRCHRSSIAATMSGRAVYHDVRWPSAVSRPPTSIRCSSTIIARRKTGASRVVG